MKSLSIRLGEILVVIGLVIFTYAVVWAEDWMFYGKTDKYSCFYDVKSISHPSENIVVVLEKEEYTSKEPRP